MDATAHEPTKPRHRNGGAFAFLRSDVRRMQALAAAMAAFSLPLAGPPLRNDLLAIAIDWTRHTYVVPVLPWLGWLTPLLYVAASLGLVAIATARMRSDRAMTAGCIAFVAATLLPLLTFVTLACGSLVVGAVMSRGRRAIAAAASATILLYGCLDHMLLQPWVWQFAVLAGLFAFPAPRAKRWAMRLLVSVYLFSAISKIDVAFVEGLGQLLAAAGFEALGLDHNAAQRTALAWAMPVAELAIAALLVTRRLRRAGLVAAIGLHVTLLVMLGPLGLDHHVGVLWWNAFSIAAAVVLFAGSDDRIVSRPRWSFANVAAGIALMLPSIEPFGLWDHWPGWSVYSARPPRVTLTVDLPEDDGSPFGLSESFAYADPPEPLSELQRIDFEAWTFDARGRPPYPSERYRVALAAAFLDALPPGTAFELTLVRPDPWRRGRRFATTETITSREGLDALRGRSWLNTTPWITPHLHKSRDEFDAMRETGAPTFSGN